MKKQPSKQGPEPARLKLEGDWEQAVKTAVRREKPPEGWPKPEPRPKKPKPDPSVKKRRGRKPKAHG